MSEPKERAADTNAQIDEDIERVRDVAPAAVQTLEMLEWVLGGTAITEAERVKLLSTQAASRAALRELALALASEEPVPAAPPASKSN